MNKTGLRKNTYKADFLTGPYKVCLKVTDFYFPPDKHQSGKIMLENVISVIDGNMTKMINRKDIIYCIFKYENFAKGKFIDLSEKIKSTPPCIWDTLIYMERMKQIPEDDINKDNQHSQLRFEEEFVLGLKKIF